MGDLRDQLKKAKLLSKKDAKRLAHEERVHRTKVGGVKGVEAERARHDDELREKREAQRRADRLAQAELQATRDAEQEASACLEILRREAFTPRRTGAVRWYFELENGQLPSLELPMTERMQLADGSLCIVRVGPPGTHDYALLRSDHGRRIQKVFPDRVAHLVGPPAVSS